MPHLVSSTGGGWGCHPFQRGHSAYIVEALEQPFLLPKDMDAVRKMKQPDLFMSLKRDLAMVSSQPHTFYLFKY